MISDINPLSCNIENSFNHINPSFGNHSNSEKFSQTHGSYNTIKELTKKLNYNSIKIKNRNSYI